MFLRTLSFKGGYGARGQQRAQSRFLMLFDVKPGGELRALVRFIKMYQLGHFMMGGVIVADRHAPLLSDGKKIHGELPASVKRYLEKAGPWARGWDLALSGTTAATVCP